MSRLYKMFLFLFLFTTFNREFRLFGFDFRYVVVLMAVVLTCTKAIELLRFSGCNSDSDDCNKSEFSNVDLGLFYIVLFLSCVAWNWNNLPVGEQLGELLILNASNALIALTLIMRRSELDVRLVMRYTLISLTVMALSMLIVYSGLELPEFLHDSSVRVGSLSTEAEGLLGSQVRVAGFAEDANYACLFSAIGLMSTIIYFRRLDIVQIGLAILFIVCVGISFSRTILIGLAVAAVVCLARALVKKSWKTVAWCCVAVISFMALYGMAHADILRSSASMTTRFGLWEHARQVFEQNPLIGGGLSSVRSAINVFYRGSWYVQCHSTFWQILAEHGIVGFTLFFVIMGRRLALCETLPQVFIVALFIMLCTTSEMEYQQIFVFCFALLPLLIGRGLSTGLMESSRETEFKETVSHASHSMVRF